MPVTEIPGFQKLYDLARTVALQGTSKLSDLSWSPGYMIDIQTGMASALAEEAIRIALELHAKHFFNRAEADDLDELAKDHFGLVRNPGVSAVGIARFSRATTAAGNVTIPAGTVLETSDGLQFVTTTAPLMTGLQIDANVAAVVPGTEGIVSPNTIISISNSTALADSSIQVTNPERTAGGLGVETDADFRERILGWFKTLRRATPAALVIGAKFVPGVVNASVDEILYPPTVYIADVTGGANAALEAAVVTELVKWRAAGIQVNVVGATVVTQDVDLSLVFRTGFDTSEVRELVEDAVQKGIASQAIGETLYSSAIVGFAQGVKGVHSTTVNNPAGDVIPAANEVLRLGTLTFS